MKRALIFALLVAFASVSVAGVTGPRTLSRSVPAASIERLVLHSGIGDVEIRTAEGIPEVEIEVVLTPRRGGFFSSKRKAEQEVEAATLKAETRGNRLKLQVAPEADDDRRFEENWSILVPANIALEITHGVGDIDIRDANSGIEVESGVGEIRIEATRGDISVELGVGTAVVRSSAASYASAEGAGGVGDARITVRGEKISSGGFVGHAANWEGQGISHIEVAVGVGDAVIRLD